MDNKFVITIGRQFGSCGKEIGQELAKRFGITFFGFERKRFVPGVFRES